MKSLCLRLLLVFTVCIAQFSCSQITSRPFYEEIEAFKQADKTAPPPTNAILFAGSSSIRYWTSLQQDFPGHRIIRRGFGGSGLNDLISYAPDIILPYKPKQVVIYSGENDIATGNVTATDVVERFTLLFNMVRKELPDADIAFISIKPSPSRIRYQPIIEDANILIRQFLSSYPETAYIDVYHPMLDRAGRPRQELFSSDSLHMNEKGYELWREAIRPYLVR